MKLARSGAALGLAALVGIGAVLAQERETAQQQQQAATSEQEEQLFIPQVPFAPGPDEPVWKRSASAADYDGNEEMIQAGQQLYAAMNCVGCHANGGGGMGPPLIDDTWIYGSSIEHIVSSIREGRPNGMPSYRGRLPDEQIWQIAAYVRSMSQEVEGN